DLYALSNTGVEVMVSVSNEEVLRIGQSPAAASWINRNLAAFNLVRLASMFIVKRSDRYKQNVEHLLVVFFKRLKDSLVVVPLMCCAADMLAVPSKNQVVLVGKKSTLEMERMLLCFH
ncbi:hypothetical protein Tco_1443085, partial [Tanacetum coccineum]